MHSQIARHVTSFAPVLRTFATEAMSPGHRNGNRHGGGSASVRRGRTNEARRLGRVALACGQRGAAPLGSLGHAHL